MAHTVQRHHGFQQIQGWHVLVVVLQQRLGLRHWVLQPCDDPRQPGSAAAARQALAGLTPGQEGWPMFQLRA